MFALTIGCNKPAEQPAQEFVCPDIEEYTLSNASTAIKGTWNWVNVESNSVQPVLATGKTLRYEFDNKLKIFSDNVLVTESDYSITINYGSPIRNQLMLTYHENIDTTAVKSDLWFRGKAECISLRNNKSGFLYLKKAQ